MPRLGMVPRSELHPFGEVMFGILFGDRDPVEEPGTPSGTPGDWWPVFANSPDCFDHCCAGFQFYRDPKRKLDPKLRELGQARAGWARGSTFVFSQHSKACRDVGLGDEQVAALPHWQVADCYDEAQRAVLAYTDALVVMGGRVADGIFEALRTHLDDEEILELTYIVMTYEMHATMSKALRTEYDDVDDPVREVADPSGRFAGLDIFEGMEGSQGAPPTR
ncbi:MAG: carboxymuconolactone decarboxylase family protein [Microthrixaceae bacterium]|nr:carboxymuconolactone decarboxylase family protein [Microthrixaceae bacterium]MCO5317012.1 carboxymuconolactone decarboxylase family protein [Microthrixaceae bacterium]